jgi:spore coat protein A, manganese oxidase
VSITRRQFLEQSGALAASLAISRNLRADPQVKARPVLDLSKITPFVDPLPIPAVARPSGKRPVPGHPDLELPYYRLAMQEFHSKLHRDLMATRMWGIAGSSPGPTLETGSDEGLLVEWVNQLPGKHFLPIDHSIHGAEASLPEVRAVIHLHGGRVPSESDGYPEGWYVPGKSAIYYYPNHQDAAMLWYHDHTLGINRLNVYAGLVGTYVVRDRVEESLNLPHGKYEVPLLISDRMLDQQGQLYYPVSDNPQSPWISELFGDAMLVNGKLFPYLEVEPRKYRFRLLNVANSRFFHLAFSNGQIFHQIGTDQGLLPAPVALKDLQLAPGERADLVVDFAGQGGAEIVLTNDTFNIMQFRVAKSGAEDTSSLPPTLRPLIRMAESTAVETRMLSLVEVDDTVARPVRMLLNNAHWSMPITESPVLDSTEIWSLINLSDDSHPIHLHLVRFQILDRQPFERFAYQSEGKLKFYGPRVPPDANELGWKDTVRADTGMVTRIIVRFEGFTGRYVWHCHILEHEDNEMMRPFEVVRAR